MDSYKNLGWPMTILDVLNTEHQYPGLQDELVIMKWQDQIIGKQLESQQAEE